MRAYKTNNSRQGKQGGRKRRCLMCRQLFASDGTHNRVCRRCKRSQQWRDGE
jgi:hypothetical protein